MTVYVGSARIDENGKARGGKAGDQTGRELSIQKWYNHEKGWRVFRAVDASKRKLIAQAIRDACANPHIGYDQGQRDTLYAIAQTINFDLSMIEKDCETDCSALVRTACAFAGIVCGGFNTKTQPSALLSTGQFTELTDCVYTDKPDYLREGDILVTRTQGHTVVVLNDGGLAYTDGDICHEPPIAALGTRTLRYTPGAAQHMRGDDVIELQRHLLALGYFKGTPLGNYKTLTTQAVRQFQAEQGLEVDGVYGKKTHAALVSAIAADVGSDDMSATATVGDNGAIVYSGIGVQVTVLGHASAGDTLTIRDYAYIPIIYNGVNCWVEAKHGRAAVPYGNPAFAFPAIPGYRFPERSNTEAAGLCPRPAGTMMAF